MEMPYQLDFLWYRTFQSVLKISNYFEDIAQMITWAKKEAIPLYPVPTAGDARISDGSLNPFENKTLSPGVLPQDFFYAY